MNANWLTCNGTMWRTEISAQNYRRLCRIAGRKVRAAKRGILTVKSRDFEEVTKIRTDAWPAGVWIC
jgi:hypothetical protein